MIFTLKMERKIEIALLIGIIVVLGFILVFYNNKDDSDFKGTYSKSYELTTEQDNSTFPNQPKKIGTVTIKSGETKRVDIKEV